MRILQQLVPSLVVGALAASCGGGDSTSEPGPEPARPTPASVRFVAGTGLTDSVGVQPKTQLIVRVLDRDGKPFQGAGVQLTVTPANDSSPPLWFGSGGRVPQLATLTDTTSSAGELAVSVRFARRAGPYSVRASVVSFGLSDSTPVVITPGNATRLRFTNPDTTAYIGTSFEPIAHVLDAYGNARSDAVSFQVASGHALLDQGRLLLLAFSPVRVRATSGAFKDSMIVRAVPRGTIAAYEWAFFFNGVRSVITVDLDGSHRRHLAASPTSVFNGEMPPSWSPDAKQIVFSDRPTEQGGYRLYVTDTLGNPKLLIPDSPLRTERWPHWSPAGDWIFFQGETVTGASSLYRVRPDGSQLTSMTTSSGAGLIGFDVNAPSPSPDGTRVAFSISHDEFGDPPTLHILTTATGAVTALNRAGSATSWSPTGEWIAYLESVDKLALIQPDGSGYRVLSTSSEGFFQPPAWSKDGKFLIIGGRMGTFTMIEIATQATLDLPVARNLLAPSWRP
jgi:hypothetical protein